MAVGGLLVSAIKCLPSSYPAGVLLDVLLTFNRLKVIH